MHGEVPVIAIRAVGVAVIPIPLALVPRRNGGILMPRVFDRPVYRAQLLPEL